MGNIFLNDLGCINALGNSKGEISQKLLTPHCTGIRAITAPFTQKPAYLAPVTNTLPALPPHLKAYACRNNQLLLAAYEQIRETVENFKQQYGAHRIGIFLGSSTSGIDRGETAIHHHEKQGEFPLDYDYTQQEMGSVAEFLAKIAGISGIHYTLSTACSSAGKAIAAAHRWLSLGLCDVAIAGGSDALCGLTTTGFDALEALSPTPCNPFSANRQGLTLGEGAALFVMSRNPSAIKLTGIGESSDGYHMTAPDPEGLGAREAILQALQTAHCSPEDIGYINLHGTGTPKNDAMESLLIHSLFGKQIPCSSTKPQIGHTLGAAAAQELALCWLLLHEVYNPKQQLPLHMWDGIYDETLPALNLTKDFHRWEIPRFMSNSFAFGGSNVSLIIEKSCESPS